MILGTPGLMLFMEKRMERLERQWEEERTKGQTGDD